MIFEFSAKKVNGIRAYDIARKGGKIILKKAIITVFDIDLELLKDNKLKFNITCSKGT